jgi:hypothetical protein
MPTNNAINLTQQGMAYYNGTGTFSAPTLTQFSVILGASANDIGSTAVGTTGQILIGAAGANPAFSGITSTGSTISFTSGPNSLNIEAISISGVLTVSHGGTGDSSLTSNTVLIGNGTNPVGSTAVGTTGQVLIGAAGAPPSFSSITSTGGTLAFTSGANSLNIDVVEGGVIWHDVTTPASTGTPNTTISNNGYSTDVSGASQTFYVLPATANFGDTLYITGRSNGGANTGGWKLQQAAGQGVTLGNSTTTSGTAGFLASTDQTDSIRLIMVKPGTGITSSEWNAIQSIGNISYN